jgi:rare lipoprotein A
MISGTRRTAIPAACCLALATTALAPACAPRRGPSRVPSRPPAPDRVIERGIASWYGKSFHGRRTASGERYDMHGLTAAHPTLPFGTRVKVRNLENGRAVVVRINDRGPSVAGRIIDLSYAAAARLGIVEAGLARVALYRVE